MLYVALVLLFINTGLLTLVAHYYIRWKSDRARMAEYQAKYHNVSQELADVKAKMPNRDSKGRFVKR
jgi:hypothetical protein